MLPSSGDQTDRRDDPSGGVTARALLVALALLALIAPAAFYVEIAWHRTVCFATYAPSMAPVVLLFLLTALMGAPLLRRAGLSRRELLVVYSVVLVGAPLVSKGLLVWLLGHNVAYYYGARTYSHWETTFLRLVPAWFAPTDTEAVVGFFQGGAAVPWSRWARPLEAWLSFEVCLFVAAFCLIVLVQRHWISDERLTFPIAQIPLEMVQQRGDSSARGVGQLPAAPLFWLGLLLSFGIAFMNDVSERAPAIPAIPLGPITVVDWHPVGPMAGLGSLDLLLWPWMIAIAYLIPKDLSFSVWFFWFVRLGLTVVAIAAGATPQRPEDWWSTSFPAPYYQGGGAVFALLAWALWSARHHLGRALRTALRGGAAGGDLHEPLSYRAAFIGLMVSTAGMVSLITLAGGRIAFALALIAMVVGYHLIWARLRAETGLGFLEFPINVQDLMVVPLGSAAFRPREIIALISLRWTYQPGGALGWDALPASVLETFKVADAAQVNARRLTPALVAGFLVSLAVGVYVVLTGMYRYGFLGMAVGSVQWVGPQTLLDGSRIYTFLADPQLSRPDVNGTIAILAGGAVAILLGIMRLRFWWWPLHPVGYVAANTWSIHWYYLPFLIGWLAKSLVVRYGGLKPYRSTIPLAIGLIVGDLLNSGAWSAVALLTQGRW
ncbi:MAG: DUF6785 family protein [Armatimonadota bacterium]